MIKETVVAVSIVTMAAGAALAPSAVSASATDTPLVVADSHEDACNPCGGEEEEEEEASFGEPIVVAECNPCDACNPCGGEEEEEEASFGEPIVVAECNPCDACNPCGGEEEEEEA